MSDERSGRTYRALLSAIIRISEDKSSNLVYHCWNHNHVAYCRDIAKCVLAPLDVEVIYECVEPDRWHTFKLVHGGKLHIVSKFYGKFMYFDDATYIRDHYLLEQTSERI